MEPKPVYYDTNLETIEKNCRITFARGSGPGGQNKNKVETGVRVYHQPSGITVVATDGRTQEENRRLALERLRRRLQRLNAALKPRIPTKVPRTQKKQRLSDKRITSARKQHRKTLDPEEN